MPDFSDWSYDATCRCPFIECKRGSNYGIRVATAAEIEACREADSIAA